MEGDVHVAAEAKKPLHCEFRMRKIVAIAAITLSALGAQARAEAKPELLSLQTVTEGSITVMLPTVRNANGTICTSYIAEASKGPDGKPDATVKQICGEANASKSGPANLVALRTFERDGVVIQLPAIDITSRADAVVIRDTRATNVGPVGAVAPVPASGELLTRRNGVCVLSAYKQTKEGIPMPVVETRTFPCDALGNAIQAPASDVSVSSGASTVLTVGNANANSACDLDGLLTLNRDGSGVLRCKDRKWTK